MAAADGLGQLTQRQVAQALGADVPNDFVEKCLSTHELHCTMRYMNQVVHVEQATTASPEQVFALLGDVASWATWSSFEESRLERPGSPTPDGVGAIRAFKYKRTRSREEVIAFEPPYRFGYKVLSGVPVKGYVANVTLTPATNGGTTITWHSTFQAKWPGTGGMARRSLTKFIRQLEVELAKAAERTA